MRVFFFLLPFISFSCSYVCTRNYTHTLNFNLIIRMSFHILMGSLVCLCVCVWYLVVSLHQIPSVFHLFALSVSLNNNLRTLYGIQYPFEMYHNHTGIGVIKEFIYKYISLLLLLYFIYLHFISYFTLFLWRVVVVFATLYFS